MSIPSASASTSGCWIFQPEIIGVVVTSSIWGLGAKGHDTFAVATLFVGLASARPVLALLSSGSGYVARTAASPLGVVSAIREAAVKGDPSSVVFGARPLQEIVGNSIATQRLAMILLSAFFPRWRWCFPRSEFTA